MDIWGILRGEVTRREAVVLQKMIVEYYLIRKVGNQGQSPQYSGNCERMDSQKLKNVAAEKAQARILILWNPAIRIIIKQRNAKAVRMAYKFKWTEEEDSLLKALKEEKQIHSWISISNQINMIQTTRIRTPKQCRERYINHVRLSPSGTQTAAEWSSLEHGNFLDLYRLHGPKWALIARAMQGRSQISLKNRFYSGFRKMIRKINSVQQMNKTSKKRFLKYENLLRIIEADKQFKDVSSTTPESELFVSNLREDILISVWNQDFLSTEEIQSLINKIHKFNSMFSYFGMRKIKFHCHSKNEDLVGENSSEKATQEEIPELNDLNEMKNESEEPQISEDKSSKELASSSLEKWEGQFQDLLDIFNRVHKLEHKSSNGQDLEEQLSHILKKDYIKPEFIFF